MDTRVIEVAPRSTWQRYRWVALTGLTFLALSCGASFQEGTSDPLEARLRAGCSSAEECRELESEARARAATCTLSCDQERRNAKVAGQLLKDALEQEAEESHKQELRELKAKRQKERQHQQELRRLAAKEEQRRAERAHQRKLELLAAETARQEMELKLKRQQHVEYLQNLSFTQKKARLALCHQQARDCETEAEMLTAAARNAREKRLLATLHEQLREQPRAQSRPLQAQSPSADHRQREPNTIL